MTTTHSLGDVRPATVAPQRPLRRRLSIALMLAASLVGGTALATSPMTAAPAEAATHAAPHLTVHRTGSTIVRGKSSPTVSVRATSKGKAVRGVAYFMVSGKTVKKIKLSGSGYARYKLSKKVALTKSGWRTVRVYVKPYKSTGLRATSKAFKVKISRTGSRVVDQAAKYVGVKYRYGGTTPSGFDCSGFTSYVYKKAGVKTLPRSSSSQRNVGKKISKKSARAGDLIWTPGHVAIYAGGNTMIDAPRPGKTIQFRQIWISNPTYIRVSSKAITV